MKKNNIKKKTGGFYGKKLALLLVVVIVVCGCIAIYAYTAGNSLFSSGQSSNEKQPESNRPAESKPSHKREVSESSPNYHEPEKNLPKQPESNVPPTNTITGSINYKNIANGKLILRTTINQALKSGSCVLTLTSGGRSVTKNTNIVQNPSSSSCAGFDVPLSELSPGRWDITITITSDGKSGTIGGVVSL